MKQPSVRVKQGAKQTGSRREGGKEGKNER